MNGAEQASGRGKTIMIPKTATALACGLLVVGMLAAGTAHGYRWKRAGLDNERLHWTNDVSVPFRVQDDSFPRGSFTRIALELAVERWNTAATPFRYELRFGERNVGRKNGQNEIWFEGDRERSVTKTWYRPVKAQFREADIIFNADDPFTPLPFVGTLWAYGGDERPFQTTALHELGHAQGLAHTRDDYSVMGTDWTHIHANGGLSYAYPGVDAMQGSFDTYSGRMPAGPTRLDLGVAHWRRTGTDGGYSVHQRTRMFYSNGLELPDIGGAEPRYIVQPGQRVRIELRFENMSSRRADSIRIEWYVSADKKIETSDTVIGASSISLAPRSDLLADVPVTLPASLAHNTDYWVGAIIDPDDRFGPEVTEQNNATYIGIRAAVPEGLY